MTHSNVWYAVQVQRRDDSEARLAFCIAGISHHLDTIPNLNDRYRYINDFLI